MTQVVIVTDYLQAVRIVGNKACALLAPTTEYIVWRNYARFPETGNPSPIHGSDGSGFEIGHLGRWTEIIAPAA